MKNMVKFLKDQRGVSPVIGVILMVAITVILGAVIAAFAYGYVGETQKAPNIVLSAQDNPADNDSLLIKHNGGESIAANDWRASVTVGKGSATDNTTQTETGAIAMYTGTTIKVTTETDSGTTDIEPGWYHVVAVHVPSDSLLLDTNVLVR